MKKKSPPYAIIGAVLLAIVGIFFAVKWKQSQDAAHAAEMAAHDKAMQDQIDALKNQQPAPVPPAPTDQRYVYYATQPIEAGAKLSSAFYEKKLTPNSILPDAFTDQTDIVGFYAVRPIEKGDPLTPRNIGKTLPFLTERISPGMRAIALNVFNTEPGNSTGGFVVDDDKVDLLFTHLTHDSSIELNTQLVLQNVKVLYVPGPKMESEQMQGVQPAPAPGGGLSVVFEVTPEEAQALVYMSQIKNGHFNMILRSRRDKDVVKIKPFEGADYVENDYRSVQKKVVDPSRLRVEELRKQIEAAEKKQSSRELRMKHLTPLHPVPKLVLLFCLLVAGGGLSRAQSPVAQRLDVYFGEATLLPIDGTIDSFSVSPDSIIKVEKSDASPNQLTITGIAGGSAALTVKSGDRTLLYEVAVSPAPVRLYINVNESKRLTFPGPVDDQALSTYGIVRVVQPDVADNVLLVNAVDVGKTTLTVTAKGQIYRYFISTFDNRGADVLEIQNAFSAKGYRNLTIKFEKDQAILGGTVPTQEELDDAVRIIKQFTDYVQVRAQLGQEAEQSEYTEQESIVINNIQRIANVKGLTVRVKFPMPTVITTSTHINSIGDYIEPETTTTPQGGTVRGTGFQPPANPNSQQGPGGGPLTLPKQENTTETTTRTENTSIPEKIFLYGDLQDDLDEAKAIRVARTFCPFVVNFITVRDPIQIRTQIRFMQIKNDDNRDTGFDWSNGGAGPTITLGFGNTSLFGLLPNPINAFKNFLVSPIATAAGAATGQGVSASVNATAILRLFEVLNIAKILREADIFLTNGQPGWYSEGEVQSYVSAAVTTASSPPLTTLTASSVFLGVNMDISPLNLVAAGGVEPQGQKIFGIPSSVGAGSSSGYNLLQDSDPTADKIGKVTAAIQRAGTIPIVDNTVKYVDENGLIGMNISTQLTLPNGGLTANTVPIPGGGSIDLPDFFVRTTRTRVSLRDGQTVAIDGLIDKEASTVINQVPFLSKIPFFSMFFKSHADNNTNEEVIVLVTPHIVRMRDPDSARYPKPIWPEMQDMAREQGDIPIIKPVRYNAQAVDIRPETPKDMKDAKSDTAPTQVPLTPHATGGMQTLQPPAASTSPAPPAVDNAPPASDNSRQPSGAPLAPSSTLP